VTFIHGELSTLGAATFDAVVISEVLEHLDVPERLLSDALDYLSPEGVLIVTVPNGYGEYELDRRLFSTLKLGPALDLASSFARRIVGRKHTTAESSSENKSPHVQRFTFGQLNTMFRDLGLEVIEKASTSFISGPLVAYTLGRIPGFVKANVAIAKRLPMSMTSGWMFALTRRT
jgi:SAM-dependent methyltransferase